MRQRRLLSVLLVAGMLAAGCSSSKKTAASSTTAASTTTASSSGGSVTTQASGSGGSGALKVASSCTGKTPSGNPYKIASLYELESPASGLFGARAAVAAINACGGVNGRPIAFSECKNNGDQNAALKCANDDVADQDVIAEGAASSSYGSLTDPIFQKANMAITGLIGPGADGTSPNFFGVMLGGLITSADAAYGVKQVPNVKVVGVPYYNIGNFGTAALANVTALVTKPAGLAAPKGVPVDPAEVNFPAKVAALGKVDVAAPALTPDLFVKFVNEARVQGFTYPFVFNTSVISEADTKGLQNPGTIDILSQFKLSGAGFDMYKKDITTAKQNDTVNDNAQSIQGWLSVHLLADVMAMVGPSVDRKSLLDALTNLKAYDTGGLTPVLDFTAKHPGLQNANVVNPAVVYYTIQNNKFVPVDGEQFHSDLITIP